MILAQPIITILLATLVVLYFARLRSRASDMLLVMLCFGVSILLVFRPDVATNLAHVFGIGRGVDLILYLTIPGLAMMVLILFAKTRDINAKLTAVVRELAISSAQSETNTDAGRR
jgi:small membrane protein